MTRHSGAKRERTGYCHRGEVFTLASTLERYEVAELTPSQAAELLVHLRRAGFPLSLLPEGPPQGD